MYRVIQTESDLTTPVSEHTGFRSIHAASAWAESQNFRHYRISKMLLVGWSTVTVH